jgi:hypothetical protein
MKLVPMRSRRARWALGSAVVLITALLMLFGVSRRRAATGGEDPIATSEPQNLPMSSIDRERSERLRMFPPTDTTTIPEVPPPAASPPLMELPPVEEPPDLAGTTPRSDSAAAALSELALNAETEPTEMALRPRLIVHPQVPEKLIRKKKIDEAILLQALVGPDGRVHDVRLLRGIGDCAECTASAIEAAKQYRYDPPGTRSGQVWTTPFEIRFSYGRR